MGYSSDNEIQTLVDQFESRVLPKSQWTHQAHLTVGMYYLYNKNFHESLCLMKAHIICYNDATGGVNSASGGYHETITVFWFKKKSDFLKTRKREPLFELCNAFLESLLSSKEMPSQYYARENCYR